MEYNMISFYLYFLLLLLSTLLLLLNKMKILMYGKILVFKGQKLEMCWYYKLMVYINGGQIKKI